MDNDQGKRLVLFRRSIGLSQNDMAKEIGISPSTLCYYERGKRRITSDVFLYLHLTYGANIHWLLSGNGRMLLSKEEVMGYAN